MLTDSGVCSTIDAVSKRFREGDGESPTVGCTLRVFWQRNGSGCRNKSLWGWPSKIFALSSADCWKLWDLDLVGASAAGGPHNRPCLCALAVSNRREAGSIGISANALLDFARWAGTSCFE